MVDPQAVDDALAHELEDLAVRDVEDLRRPRRAPPARSSMSKKRRYQPSRGSKSKNLARSSSSAHQRFSSDAHVVGDDVEHDRQARAAASARRPVLAAERVARRASGRRRRSRASSRDRACSDGERYRCEMPRSRRYGTSSRDARRSRARARAAGGRSRAHATARAAASSSATARSRSPRAGKRVDARLDAPGRTCTSSSVHAAPKRRGGQRERHVLVVGVEQQQERVVARSRSPLRRRGRRSPRR